jgi:hypothetical protein
MDGTVSAGFYTAISVAVEASNRAAIDIGSGFGVVSWQSMKAILEPEH